MRFTIDSWSGPPVRHYTDLVLVAVVALCTQENDVVHAGYLALALLFFRRRDALQAERNRRVLTLRTLTMSGALMRQRQQPAQYSIVSQTCQMDSRRAIYGPLELFAYPDFSAGMF